MAGPSPPPTNPQVANLGATSGREWAQLFAKQNVSAMRAMLLSSCAHMRATFLTAWIEALEPSTASRCPRGHDRNAP